MLKTYTPYILDYKLRVYLKKKQKKDVRKIFYCAFQIFISIKKL